MHPFIALSIQFLRRSPSEPQVGVGLVDTTLLDAGVNFDICLKGSKAGMTVSFSLVSLIMCNIRMACSGWEVDYSWMVRINHHEIWKALG